MNWIESFEILIRIQMIQLISFSELNEIGWNNWLIEIEMNQLSWLGWLSSNSKVQFGNVVGIDWNGIDSGWNELTWIWMNWIQSFEILIRIQMIQLM